MKNQDARHLEHPRPGPDNPAESAWAVSRWLTAASLGVAITLLLVSGTIVWGVFHDLQLLRQTLLQGEINRVRSGGVRTAGRIEDHLRQLGAPGDLTRLRGSPFLRDIWERTLMHDPSRLYAAVTDRAGVVVAHSRPELVGQTLSGAWYQRQVEEAGDDVVETVSPGLTGGQAALDVQVPIMDDQAEIGTYHAALSRDWLEGEYAQRRAQTLTVWAWITALLLVCVLAAAISLFQIGRRVTMMSQAVKLGLLHRFAELGQFMAGIVHEVRNPLNAMRLNLHMLQRRFPATPDDGEDSAGVLLAEVNREIERIEGLMRSLLRYARPGQPNNEVIDLRDELRAALAFLRPLLEQAEVAVQLQAPVEPLRICMDRDRLRQIIINLVTNARDAVGPAGTIKVLLSRQGESVELVVADDGPGVPPADRERVFQPFYSSKEFGTGLGLAIVKRFVEEVGGAVSCERNTPAGARFCVCFREASGP